MKSYLIDLATRYRAWILVCVGLPLGMIFDTVMRLRHLLYELFLSSPEEHDRRVQQVQEQVRRRQALPAEQRKPMCTDRKTWMNLSTRFAPKERWHPIAMSGLQDILSVDLHRRVVRVEPFVTVGQVTRFLLARGFMLEVTLEIEDATVGGLAMAVGMTTHSHKAGLLQETVLAYDVVLADGNLVRATASEHVDLFRALPWSHGTLGLLVALELRIIPVKPFVHLTYAPVHSQKEYCDRLQALATSADAPDFIEAIVFAKDRAVIVTGELAEAPANAPSDGPIDGPGNPPINRIGRWHKPWFYKHVESYLAQGGEEYVPLRHYLMRHNRSIFWVVADMISFGNHPVFRWLLGWLMPPKIAFLKFSTTPAVRKMTFTKQVFQDIVLPMSAMTSAIDLADELFQLYPILLYPSLIRDHGTLQGQLRAPRPADRIPGTDAGMYFDLGVYGVPLPIKQGRPFKILHALRRMEEFTRQVGGYPFLYADTFMTRDEFRAMFDHDLYDQVRKKYGAEGAFPELYEKIKPEVDVFAVLDEEDEEGPNREDGEAREGK